MQAARDGGSNDSSTSSIPHEAVRSQAASSVPPFYSSVQGQKRRCGGKEDGEEEDNERGQPPPRKLRNKEPSDPESPRFLACPFWKLDAQTHWKCYPQRFLAMSRILEPSSHLPARMSLAPHRIRRKLRCSSREGTQRWYYTQPGPRRVRPIG